ncbi:MAG: esterase [Oscillospiraceae bacterium]|nr:esterase [Oscillospiraceae bacterium]
MERFEYGSADADTVLIQPVDAHDLALMESEIAAIAERCDIPFRLIAVKVENWNTALSPWEAPAVFGKEPFGSGAAETLRELLTLCTDTRKRYYIGGYSLAGLFALWAVTQTDVFSGAAAASPSLWFPSFLDWLHTHELRCNTVCLSLGDREPHTRNPVMATVGNRIREAYDLLQQRGIRCVLEWNRGNHFQEPDIRTGKAFAWVINRKKEELHHDAD